MSQKVRNSLKCCSSNGLSTNHKQNAIGITSEGNESCKQFPPPNMIESIFVNHFFDSTNLIILYSLFSMLIWTY